ncbi:MAG: shikimate kinase [Planctomycetota bacterium]|nr:MAG: shikimate kinase [Planctomycetota bacterium]
MHIYLLGFRGCGKTTVGQRLAHRLGIPFIDTDLLIEAEASKSIAAIFSDEGEQGFRDREEQAIEQCSRRRCATVISLGGGAVLRPANRQRICRTGRRIWLTASPRTHYQRMQSDGSTADRRPALTDRDAFSEITEVLQQREPLYAEVAEKVLSTEDKTPDQIVEEIANWLIDIDWRDADG